MIYYSEKTGRTLLSGSATAVSRVNGMAPGSWPAVVTFGRHRLEIHQDGTLRLGHDGPLSENPPLGQREELGSFTFHLTDGKGEGAEQAATVSLNGVAVKPQRIDWTPAALTAGADAGTLVGVLESLATSPVTYNLVDSTVPAALTGAEVKATGPVPAGTHSLTVEAANAKGTLRQTFPLEVRERVETSGIYRGQHDPDDPAYAGPTGVESEFYTRDWGTPLHPSAGRRYVHVSTKGSDTTGDGSAGAPYKTIGRAVHPENYTPGDTVLVEPGIYPEKVNIGLSWPRYEPSPTATNRIKIARKGTGQVIVHGGDLVGGWTRCASPSDAEGNPNWASMYRTTITKSEWIDILDAQMMEGAQAAFMVMDGPGYDETAKMFSRGYYRWFYQDTDGVTYQQSGSNLIISHPRFADFVQGQLVGREISVHQSLNKNQNVSQRLIDAHDAGRGTVTLNGFFSQATDTVFNGRFALAGFTRSVSAPGQWGYLDNGNGTVTIWYWPYSNVADVRLSTRAGGIIMRSGDITLYGIDSMGQGGDDTEKNPFGHPAVTTGYSNLHLEECRAYASSVGGHYNTSIDVGTGADGRILNCTADTQRGKGISVQSNDGGHIKRCLVKRCSNTGINLSGSKNTVCMENRLTQVFAAHGNGMSCYQGSNNILVAFNIIETWEDGEEVAAIPATFQKSANVWYVRNLVSTAALAGGRGIEDNSTLSAADEGITPGPVHHMGNTIVPWKTATGRDAGTGLKTGNMRDATHNVVGNIVYGWADNGNGTRGRYADNLFVAPPYGGVTTSGTNIAALPEHLWADYRTRDYTPVSAALGVMSDHSDLLPSGEWVAGIDFNRDVHGNPMGWTRRGAIAPS